MIASLPRAGPGRHVLDQIVAKPAPGHVKAVEAAGARDFGLRLGHRLDLAVGREIGPVGREAPARRQRVEAARPERRVELRPARRESYRSTRIASNLLRSSRRESAGRCRCTDRLAQVEPALGDRRRRSRRNRRGSARIPADRRGRTATSPRRRPRAAAPSPAARQARRPATSAARNGRPDAPGTADPCSTAR